MSSNKIITLEDIKSALAESKFRNLFLPDLKEEIDEWIINPGCKCNIVLYNTIMASIEKLKIHFGNNITVEYIPVPEGEDQVNHWTVFNGHIDELNEFLRTLPYGPKQVVISRYEDQITCIVNDPDFI